MLCSSYSECKILKPINKVSLTDRRGYRVHLITMSTEIAELYHAPETNNTVC